MMTLSFTVIEIVVSLPLDIRFLSMANSNQHVIVHPGVVDHCGHDKVFVRILSQSACSTCQVKGACSIAEVEEKIIEIQPVDPENYKPGDQVTVRMKQSLGRKALILGYIIPLIILVVAIIVFTLVLNNEGLAALLSILLLVPYYTVLYFLRDKLKQQFSFSLYSGE
jgi:sigma-E factor negative regulatory protein RseC